MSKPYHINKAVVGYGGIHCPCCTNFNSVKKCRIAINRRERRTTKISLKMVEIE